MIELSIIILSYNTKELLDVCLTSIFTNTKGLTFEVIVVDNASNDGSAELVKKKYPQVLLTQNKENLGYSAGNNLGIKKAQGEFVLLLNSDTQIIGDSLRSMVEFAKDDKNIGILGPKIVNPDESPQKSVGSFYSLGNIILAMFGGERLGFGRQSPDKFCFVDWVSGACLMIRREVLEKIGRLDEKLFMYMEEVELCFRAKKKGILTAFFPKALIMHKNLGSSQSGKTGAVLNIYKGLLYFYAKYYPAWQLEILRLVLKLKSTLLYGLGKIINNNYLVSTYGQALEILR